MGVIDCEFTDAERARPVEAEQVDETVALWMAIEADRLAADERTARLRAMRLMLCEENGA